MAEETSPRPIVVKKIKKVAGGHHGGAWKIAYADHELHRYEEHVIRRLSDLIHVPHHEFIAAKHRVENTLKK